MDKLSPESVASVLVLAGAVAVIPTDTVYGLVARAADPDAVKKMYAVKGRSGGKPGTMIGGNIEQLSTLGLTRRYLKAVEQFWPGAVSVILPVPEGLSYLSQGMPALPVRVPDDDFLSSVLALTGPLMTTSANHPDKPIAANEAEARKYFGDKVDAYFGGVDLTDRLPSTIIRIVDDTVDIIRQGAVIIPGS